MDDGRIGHAELQIGDGVLYLADEYPELGLKAPDPQATSVSLMLHVRRHRRHAGPGAGTRRRTCSGSRTRTTAHARATIVDPFGHRWMLSGPVTGAAIPIQHGDVGYVSVWTPDADRAAAFYGHVLGWTYDPATHQVTNTRQHIGIFSVDRPPDAVLLLRGCRSRRRPAVDRGRRRQVDELEQFDFGTVLDATDSQGIVVRGLPAAPGHRVPSSTALGQANFRTSPTRFRTRRRSRRSIAGCCSGPSSRAASTTAGRWQRPTRWPGIAGGSAQQVTVPMWTVADIDAAVARVREAGGTVIEEPSQQPYGKMAHCTDDQGGRFYLGEF